MENIENKIKNKFDGPELIKLKEERAQLIKGMMKLSK